MRSRGCFAAAVLLGAGGCGAADAGLADAGSPDSRAEFIAQDSDFALFESWQRFELGDTPIDGHPVGARVGFRNRPAPLGATRYPVGTILVKEIQSDPDFNQWELFGMVKRGGGYNAAGAVDWEFFILGFTAMRVPVALARGTSPGGRAGGSHGYAGPGGNAIPCNICHAAPGTAATDHVLSALLRPGG